MALKENLEVLTEKYQGRIGPKLGSGAYPDVNQIIEVIADLQEAILEATLDKLIEDPVALVSSTGVAWFFIGLLYSHEFGIPSEVVRLFQNNQSTD